MISNSFGQSLLLPQSLRYFPAKNARYEVAPGLKPLNFSAEDSQSFFFQIDENFSHFRKSKLEALSKNLQKYNPSYSSYLSEEEMNVVCAFIIDRLALEWPQFFQKTAPLELKCALTNETISPSKIPSGRVNLWDALATQVQEDLAVWKWDLNEGKEYLAALHLCAPNHWAAQDKIGKSFVSVHQPVAEIEPINKNVEGMLRAMVHKGPFERFAWGVATDNRLNHHPEADPPMTQNEWAGRAFDSERPQLYMRVERQTLNPFPKEGLSLFTIRTYFLDSKDMNAEEREKLCQAIDSMSEKSLVYKGLKDSKEAVKAYLRSLG